MSLTDARGKDARNDIAASREQFRDLSIHIETVREAERKRIARDIHDELGQGLTTLKVELSLLREELKGYAPDVGQRLTDMSDILDGTIKSVQRIIAELRPQILDDLGLTAAIEWQAADFQKRLGIPVTLSIYPAEILLDADRSTALFRILQEALSNVARHASATSVNVNLTEIAGTVEMIVADDGRGVTTAQLTDTRSFGLMGIEERARSLGGAAEISGSPGAGTRVLVRFTTADEVAGR